MTNTKLNIIRVNIITAILTLIRISCAPINTINPKKNQKKTNKTLKADLVNLRYMDKKFKILSGNLNLVRD
nr:complement regulator-acquiring protein [Borreliella yangtzensis]WKC74843.1 complement regulator-acquiring protein [Borreliella yangtzensis]